MLEKEDVVITNFDNTNISNLMIGIKYLLSFVKKSANKIYYCDCIRSTSQSQNQRFRKSVRGANYGIFFFPPAVAGDKSRMFRSRWKNTFLEEGEKVTYMISEKTAEKINEGSILLPDIVLGKPMFLLYQKHMKLAMRRLEESKKRKRKNPEERKKKKPRVLKNKHLKTLAHVASTFVRET